MKKIWFALGVIAVFYGIYILLFLARFDFNPSATVEFSQETAVQYAQDLPAGLVVQTSTSGYDGQRYYLMALDPLLSKFRVGRFFWQRILYPDLAWAFAFGRPALIPLSMLLINYFSVLLSCLLLMHILIKLKANEGLVYFWAFHVGFLVCVIRNLTEPLMMLWIVGSLFLMRREKHIAASACLALALVTKEAAFVVYGAAILFFLARKEWKKGLIYGAGVIPFCLWQAMLYAKTGHVPVFEIFEHLHYGSRGFSIGLMDYLYFIPGYCMRYVIPSLSEGVFLSLEFIRSFYQAFSPLLIVVFFFIQLVITMTVLVKERRVSFTAIVILCQALLTFCLSGHIFLKGALFGLGRFSMVMFLFAVIFYAENHAGYGYRLKGLSLALVALALIMSGLYVAEKIIYFHPAYYVT